MTNTKMHFLISLIVISLLGSYVAEGRDLLPYILQKIEVRSHGCGEHPFKKLYSNTVGEFTVEELLHVLKTMKPTDLPSDLELLLRKYDDCQKTGEQRFKKDRLNELYEEFKN